MFVNLNTVNGNKGNITDGLALAFCKAGQDKARMKPLSGPARLGLFRLSLAWLLASGQARTVLDAISCIAMSKNWVSTSR